MNGESVDQLANDLLDHENGQLTKAEREVLAKIAKRHVRNLKRDAQEDEAESFGDHLSDRVAEVGGSWGFIIAFGVVLFTWMLINSPFTKSIGLDFDPYPFIFLNLMLSMLAAVQAPIIMMSQNRQSDKDREAAAHDYEINMRAELEICELHRKLDQVLDRLEAMEGGKK